MLIFVAAGKRHLTRILRVRATRPLRGTRRGRKVAAASKACIVSSVGERVRLTYPRQGRPRPSCLAGSGPRGGKVAMFVNYRHGCGYPRPPADAKQRGRHANNTPRKSRTRSELPGMDTRRRQAPATPPQKSQTPHTTFQIAMPIQRQVEQTARGNLRNETRGKPEHTRL